VRFFVGDCHGVVPVIVPDIGLTFIQAFVRVYQQKANRPRAGLRIGLRRMLACVEEHFENSLQHKAELPGRPVLRPAHGQFIVQGRSLGRELVLALVSSGF
jgi:hypothetical protein